MYVEIDIDIDVYTKHICLQQTVEDSQDSKYNLF